MAVDEETVDSRFSRRTFMKTTGVAAAAGAAGVGVPSAAADHAGFHGEFANWRVREARKVWDRGFRGRPDRSIGLTDSGIDSRHPDLGPWNGVQAVVEDGSLALTGPELESRERVTADKDPVTASGTIGPGVFVTGDEVELVQFTVAESDGLDELDATLSWDPFAENGNDLELRLDEKVSDDPVEWEPVKTAATGGMPEQLLGVQLDAGDYRFVAEQYKNVTCQYDLEAEFFRYEGELETYDDGVVFETTADGDVVPTQQRTDAPDLTPKTIGWFNETARYGDYDRPRDGNGHGSHCTSIMGGSGRACQPDPETVVEEKPRTVLVAGDTLQYEVDAEAGTGVFISAYGDGIEVVIEAPNGEELAIAEIEVLTSSADTSEWDNNVAVAAAEETGTYTAYVRAAKGEFASAARVQEVSAGALLENTVATGDRTAGGDTTINAGVAPNASLVGLQGLSDPAISLGEYAQQFSELFNLRSVNMSWGYQGGLPLGGLGQGLDGGVVSAIKSAAESGILTVAAAGNAATPANGNGAPAVADEAISVVSTGPLDGIVAYSSGGLGGNDEDDEGTYMKPDVTAPGGSATDSIDAADIGDPDDDTLVDGDVRGYTAKSGTSMASPFTNGVAGLVAEAMEFGAPDQLSIAAPADAGLEDVLKLKHVILSTASQTALTAAPYHRGHNPVYNHGDRDPYEGYGRVNPDAAVDAVSRELLDGSDLADDESTSASSSEFVGLDLPEDPRAIAGYVTGRGGELTVSVDFSHYGGGNKEMAKGNPHIDLFVYNTEPDVNGEPNIESSILATQGVGDVSVTVPGAGPGEEPTEETYFVVAKLVNVPGVVNGYDVQAHFDLDVEFQAGAVPEVTTEFSASGSRSDDGSVFTGGQTNEVQITVETFENAEEIEVFDKMPEGWGVDPDFGGVEDVTKDGTVKFSDTVADTQVENDGEVSFVYFAEAPEGVDQTGRYTFGPARAEVVTAAVPDDDSDGELDGDGSDEFGSTDTNTVVGPST